MSCLFIILVAGAFGLELPAQYVIDDSARLIAFYSVKYPELESEILSVSNREFTVTFIKSMAWTLHSIAFKGKAVNLGQGSAATGTVISWLTPKTGKLDWAGTGHGRETVNEVVLIVDGTTNRLVTRGKDVYDRTKTFSGRKISLLKQSTIGPFSHEAQFDLPATGSYYVVTQRYRFNESVTTNRFSGGYTFMQMMPRTMNEWITLAADGTTKEGRVDAAAIDADEKSRQTVVPLGAFKALVCYSPEWKMGVAYVFAQEYSGDNHINQRPRKDIKFRASLMTNTCYNASDKLEFHLKVAPFEADPTEWKEKGKTLGMKTGF